VQATNTRPRFEVVADGQGVCSHVGAALLGELSDRLGLTGELGRRANLGVRAGAHDRGQVLRDLVVMLADGGDCVSDLASLRNQPELLGQVASTPTAWRILAEELPADPRGISGLWHVAGRIVRHARRVIVRIDRTWPWATDLVMAFARLRALVRPLLTPEQATLPGCEFASATP
jgi:DDE family transposase